MSNPKRVWDSKKRAVRQWKEQVWLENGEKVVNTNHWFAEATWEDVVYDSSWEVAQEPLQTYENWWSEDVPSESSIIINKDLSITSWQEFTDLKIYFYAKNIANISVDISSPWFDLKGIEAETGEWYNYVATITVLAVDEATAVFTDSVTGDSDSIELKWEMPPIPPTPDPYVVNEHTIAYYPFEDDTDNYATEWTDLSLVNGWTFTKSTIWYSFSWPARSKFSLESNDIRYASVWFYCNDDNFDPTGNIVVNNYQLVWDIQANAHHWRAEFDNKFVFWQGGNWSNPQSVSLWAEKQWHQVSWSYDDTTTTVAMYIDWQRVLLSQNGAYNYGDDYNAVQLLYAGHISYELIVSDLILEDRPWTDEEVEAYYELSSSKYPEPEPIRVESLSNIPDVADVIEGNSTAIYFQYSPTNADNITDQISIVSADENVVSISGIYDQGDGWAYVSFTWVWVWQTTFTYYLNGTQVATTTVTVAAEIHMSSLSAPSVNSLTVVQGQMDRNSITATYLPINANLCEVETTVDDYNICDSFFVYTWQNWNLTFSVSWTSVWSTQVHYFLSSDPTTVYDIDITVVAPVPVQSIDVSGWETNINMDLYSTSSHTYGITPSGANQLDNIWITFSVDWIATFHDVKIVDSNNLELTFYWQQEGSTVASVWLWDVLQGTININVTAPIPVTAVTIEEWESKTVELNSNINFWLDVTPWNANDVSTLSASVADDSICNVTFSYQEGNWVRCIFIWTAVWNTTVEIFCSWVSQWTIWVTVTAPQ